MGNPILPNISEFNDDVLNPSLTLEYDLNEDVLLYASYKESFRAGGFNAAAVGLRLPGETFGSDFNFDREDIDFRVSLEAHHALKSSSRPDLKHHPARRQ